MKPTGDSGESTSPPGPNIEEKGFIFDERYAEAIFNDPDGHKVLGKTLPCFSAWRRTLLERHDSPFMLGDKPSPYQLLQAVDCCLCSFPNMPRKPKNLWQRICELSRKLKIERRAEKNPKWFNAEVEKFSAYLKDYMAFPTFMMGDKAKGSGGIPQIDQTLMDVALYRCYTGCSREEAWDIPIGELSWMNASMAKTQGVDIRIVSTEEEKMVRLIKLQHLAEEEAKKQQEEESNG
jgi:hypothetical protein